VIKPGDNGCGCNHTGVLTVGGVITPWYKD